MATLRLEDLVAGQHKLAAQEGRQRPATEQPVDEMKLYVLIGLWLLLTFYIVIRVLSWIAVGIATLIVAYRVRHRKAKRR
jgi:hypothetical protein